MESKLLNMLLFRQSLLVRHLSNSLKEVGMQLETQKSFLAELKNATDYFKSEFGKSELEGFPVMKSTEIVPEVKKRRQDVFPNGRDPLECQE
jgi:hypothetical protein